MFVERAEADTDICVYRIRSDPDSLRVKTTGSEKVRHGVADTHFRHELDRLKQKISVMEKQAKGLRDRIDGIATGSGKKRCAVVDRLRCTGCGICERVCPADAITITSVARVNRERCTGCGICARNCPQGAIFLRKKDEDAAL